MNETILDAIEVLRIVRADGHLTIAGGAASRAEIDCDMAPQVTREGARAEVSLRAHATVRVPAGVAIEVGECAGHLEVKDFTAPLVLGRIGGNVRADSIGSLSVRDRVTGNVRIDNAGAIDGAEVGGGVEIENARSVAIASVSGNFEARKVDLAAAVDRIGGNAFVEQIGGALRSRTIGGKLYVDRAGEIDIENVGGKARMMEISGSVRISKVGGKVLMQSIGGDVKIDAISGHAALAGVGGSLDLPVVGGAANLRGPFPKGMTWNVNARGRISVEVDSEASLDVTAASRWGRVRVFGLDSANLERREHRGVHGTIGAARPDSERTRLVLEARHADIIFARAGSHDRDYCRRGYGRRFHGAFEELGEILAEEFGDRVPDFVNSLLGVAGEFVGGGPWSGSFVRNVAEDAARSVREAMAEAERAFAELGEKLPRDIANSIEEFGRRLSDIIRRAAAEGRSRSREGREETRDRIRDAALQMRDSIRAAVRAARERRDESPLPSEPQPKESARTAPFTPASHRRDIMDILNAVRDGKLDPAEADEMIAALMEVEQASRSSAG